VELMGETISFAHRKAIKSQVMADFLAEWVDTQLPTAPIQPELWTMYFDGSLMKTGAGAGLLFISSLGKHVRYVLRLHFTVSNNVAEDEALVNGLHIAIELGVRRLDARGDSQLVIDQFMKNSHYCDQKMEAYCDKVRRLEDKFHGLELNHVARRYNQTADELAKIALGRTTVPPNVFSRDKSCYKKYTWGLAATMQHLGPSLETLFDKVSTGRPRWPTPLGLYAPAEGVNSTRDRRTCPLRPCKQYPSLGCLPYGVWTSSVPCIRHLGASSTCWSPSTNSPSGSRSDP
jgi:ribonuclease HI